MLINSGTVSINTEVYRKYDPEKTTIIFIHGFTGSLKEWEKVLPLIDDKYNKISVDLLGHGKSSVPDDPQKYSSESINNYLFDVINNYTKDKVILFGYSMGGRASLSFAVAYPEKLKALVLESSSAGISKEAERNIRKENDAKLAELILNNPVEDFISKWMDQELFGTLKRFSNAKLDEMKKEKSKNSRMGLANTLRGFSTGEMPYFGNNLKTLMFPVLLLSGQLDSKFTKISSHLQNQFPKAKHSVIMCAGHNTHLEEPKYFMQSVNKFLKQF